MCLNRTKVLTTSLVESEVVLTNCAKATFGSPIKSKPNTMEISLLASCCGGVVVVVLGVGARALLMQG